MKVNIPREIEDPHYRYKMPILNIKSEGRGNGLKTRLCNINDIAKALERDPNHIAKFFGFELGTQVTTQDGFLLNGQHEPQALMLLLDSFIEKYVLCEWCQNPETDFFVKKQSLRLKCRACGQRNECDPMHKITNHIIKSLVE